jgi:hypothetical protein
MIFEHTSIGSSPRATHTVTLSHSAYLVLELLRRRTAFSVRGRWRIRGRRRAIETLILSSLLGSGLAERVVIDQWLQLRLTRAGRSVPPAPDSDARASARRKFRGGKTIRRGTARSASSVA